MKGRFRMVSRSTIQTREGSMAEEIIIYGKES
jgi:hypothetical protein